MYSVKYNKNRDNKFLAVAGVNKPLFIIFNMNTFKFEQGLKEYNKPSPILGTGDNFSPCFSCGCGDGRARIYNFNIQT